MHRIPSGPVTGSEVTTVSVSKNEKKFKGWGWRLQTVSLRGTSLSHGMILSLFLRR